LNATLYRLRCGFPEADMKCYLKETRMRRETTLLSVMSLSVVFAGAVHADGPSGKEVNLFSGKDLSGWEHFLVDENAKLEDVWSVEDGILICQGKPGGYLCTKKMYESFKLVVEWRWPGKPGNSGVLMRITGKPTMLPNCVEGPVAQRQRRRHVRLPGLQD